jgi:hypothetical protein
MSPWIIVCAVQLATIVVLSILCGHLRYSRQISQDVANDSIKRELRTRSENDELQRLLEWEKARIR